jgi:hypothetical protein
MARAVVVLLTAIQAYNHILADFTVCPFTPDKPGVMRMVCVDSATKVTVRPGGLDSPVTPDRRR